MNAKSTELFVIGGAMIFFLAICAVAVWAFVRQYRREHSKDDARRDDP
jgi:flagellar biogenesis protein FliO